MSSSTADCAEPEAMTLSPHRSSRPILLANPGADLYGSDRMLLETVAGLVQRGERVIVTMPQGGPLVQEIGARGGEVALTPTPIIRKASLRPAGFLHLAGSAIAAVLPGLALLHRLRPKALLVNTITAPLWIPLARMARIPVICHVHEGEASVPGIVRAAINLPLLLANSLIINSRFSRDVLTAAIGRLAGKAHIVYNAVPGPDLPTPPREDLKGSVRLLYVGRLSPRKGPDVAIEALRVLTERGSDARLDLVGGVFPGYEWFEDQLKQSVADYGLSDRVTFHGFQREVWPHSAQADIVLVPSVIDEPFGNTAVEAALAARPLIVSATSGLLEASDGLTACIRVAPGRASEIADAVETMTAEWYDFSAAATADARVAKSRYSADRYRKEIYEILTSVTSH